MPPGAIALTAAFGLGFQLLAVPAATVVSKAAMLDRAAPPIVVKLPAVYKMVPLKARGEIEDPLLVLLGFQLVAAPVPVPKAAIKEREAPPMLVENVPAA